jgi:GT2 family glycosyltransferase
LRALEETSAEIIVVDNHSSDGSREYLPPLFPQVRFYFNEQNTGFARANNQALAGAKGEYILFLNPDTLVPENSIRSSLDFIRQYPRAAALGVRMIDGRGFFLPESKRDFPTPAASLYKLTGLAALFPKSGLFNRYALGGLDERTNHQVAVLAGAFMLVRRECLAITGGFDDAYFLYGEDIDLSYRIRQAGYENLYFSEKAIIHFKGESSAENSFARLRFFYRAMLIFVQKHYRTGKRKPFVWLLQAAIGFRALFAALKPVFLPLTDMALVWISIKLVSGLFVLLMRNGKPFDPYWVPWLFPAFAFVFTVAAGFAGLYRKKTTNRVMIRSLGLATIFLLALYSLLPENIRFSRAVVLLGGIIGAGFVFIRHQLTNAGDSNSDNEQGRTVVVGSIAEYAAIKQLLTNAMQEERLLGRIWPDHADNESLCSLDTFDLLRKKMKINSVIFCIGYLPLTEVMVLIEKLKNKGLRFLFHVAGTASIVGSHELSPAAEIVTGQVYYRLGEPHQQRMKRVADVFVALILLLSVPVCWLFIRNSRMFLKQIFRVLSGSHTWVGYSADAENLPPIRTGVLTTTGAGLDFSQAVKERADRLYAKNYDWWHDICVVFKHYRQLGLTRAYNI